MKQFSNSKSRKGFTLIELIIVISLMTFMSTIGIVAYRDYNQRQLLDTAAQDLAATIQLAKSRSISQVRPSSCGEYGLDGYRINIPSLSAPEYKISAICEESSFDTRTFKLPRGVEFVDGDTTVLPGEIQGTGILFSISTLEVQGAGDIILETQGNKRIKISVDSVGTIRLEPL